MAAPTKLTPAVASSVCESLRDGLTQAMAARLAGVSPPSLSAWLKAGAEERERIDEIEADGVTIAVPDPSKTLYLDLFDAVQRARDEWQARLVGAIRHKVIDPSATSLNDLIKLAARFDDRFAEAPKRTEISGPNGGAVEIKTGVEVLAMVDEIMSGYSEDDEDD